MRQKLSGPIEAHGPFIISILAWSFPRMVTMNWEENWEGHCQGQKGQIWLMPKCIASCSFSEVILVLFSNFNCVD